MARKQHRAILLQDVDHLGARGDVVSVKSGYLRNYLVPRRLAEQATEARIAEIKQTESVRAKQQARTTEQAQEIARTLTTTILTIPVLAGAGDRLYGSVTPADIADEIWRARKIRVDRRKVQLDEPIRRLGTYQVDIEVFPEVDRDGQDDGRARRGLDVRPARPRGLTARLVRVRCSRRKERDASRARAARRATARLGARVEGRPVSVPEREDVPGRLPPQDLDAEQSVLGAMLLSEAAVAEATEVLKAEDFYRGGHGEIFAAMLDLYQQSEPVDQVSVCDRLDQRGSLEQVGGRPAVFALAEAVARRHERPALRRDRARDGHAARADPRRHRGRAARLRPPGRHARAARHGRAEGLRDRAERHDRGLHAHQAAARRGLPPAHAAVRERRRQRRHGPSDRLRRARSPDLRPAEVEPRDPGRPAVDGQDEPRAQHRRARRGDAAEAGRAVLARDVQGRDRPAPAVLGRQGRPEPPEAGPARGRRLDARHRARWRRSAARRSSSTTRAR